MHIFLLLSISFSFLLSLMLLLCQEPVFASVYSNSTPQYVMCFNQVTPLVCCDSCCRGDVSLDTSAPCVCVCV